MSKAQFSATYLVNIEIIHGNLSLKNIYPKTETVSLNPKPMSDFLYLTKTNFGLTCENCVLHAFECIHLVTIKSRKGYHLSDLMTLRAWFLGHFS